MKYKTCPECEGSGDRYVYPTHEQPEEWPPCDTCDGTARIVDCRATTIDFENRIAVLEAFVITVQKREAKKIRVVPVMENSTDY